MVTTACGCGDSYSVRFIYNEGRSFVVDLVALFSALKWLNIQITGSCEGGLPVVRMLCISTFAVTGDQEWKSDRAGISTFVIGIYFTTLCQLLGLYTIGWKSTWLWLVS